MWVGLIWTNCNDKSKFGKIGIFFVITFKQNVCWTSWHIIFIFLQDRVKTILISTNIAKSIIVKTSTTCTMNVSSFCFQASDTSKHHGNSVHNVYICRISTNDTPVDWLVCAAVTTKPSAGIWSHAFKSSFLMCWDEILTPILNVRYTSKCMFTPYSVYTRELVATRANISTTLKTVRLQTNYAM